MNILERIKNNSTLYDIIKIINSNKFFYILFFIYFLAITLDGSTYSTDYALTAKISRLLKNFARMFLALRIICIFLLQYKNFSITKFKSLDLFRKIIICVLAILFISTAINFLVTRSKSLIDILLILISASTISFDDMCDITCYYQLIMMIFITFSCSFGIISNFVNVREDGFVRNSLGYGYPTNFSTYLLGFTMLYLYKKKLSVCFFELFITQLLYILSYFLTDSRTQLMIGEFVILLCVFNKLNILSRLKKYIIKIEKVGIALFPLFPVGSFLLAWIYQLGGRFIWDLNTILSNRMAQTCRAILDHGLPLFGKNITFIGHGAQDVSKFGKVKSNYVDNSYMKMIFNHGLIVLICFIILIFICLVYLYTKHKYMQISLCFIYLIFALINPVLLAFRACPLIFIIFPTIIDILKDKSLQLEHIYRR